MKVALLCALLALPAAGVGTPQRNVTMSRAGGRPFEFAARQGQAPLGKKLARGQFLVAKRGVSDPNFAETVILLLSYGDDRGAMGLIINRPTQVRLGSALPDIKELQDRSDRVFMGGPVALNTILLLVRSKTRLDGAQPIFGDVYASGSLKVLHNVLNNTSKTARVRAYAGYAGWGPGQLEHEIDRGDWMIAPADAGVVFESEPAEIWPRLTNRLSVEWTRTEDEPQFCELVPRTELTTSSR